MASPIPTGMYYIVSVGASSNAAEGRAFVLCRKGAAGNDSNRMVIYRQDYHPTPAIASVYADEDGSEIAIVAPALSGKVACVRQKDLYKPDPDKDTLVPKTNVDLWAEANWGGRRGRWTLEAVGGLFGYYDGQPYQAYRILSAMNDGDHKVEIATSGTTNGSGVKVQAYADATGALSHFWFFVPVPGVPAGFYNIRLATDVHRLLVGQSNGSVVLSGDSDRMDNRDVWIVGKDDLEPDHQTIRNLGAYLDNDKKGGWFLVSGGQNKEKGRPSVGNLTDGGRWDRWVITPRDQSDEYNDNTYQAYELWSTAFDYQFWSVSRYVLAAYQNGSANLLTYPEFRLINRNWAGDKRTLQWFLTWAHAYNKDLVVPSKLGLDLHDVTNYGPFGVAGTENVYPSWVGGSNDDWQIRYRFTSFRYATDSSSASNRPNPDSSWKSIFDDDPANDGWGDNEVPNGNATLSYNEGGGSSKGAFGRYRSNLSIPVTLGTGPGEMDCVHLEFQVRAWEERFDKISDDVSCHGGSSSMAFMIAYRPTLELSNLKVDAYGLYLDYSSDFHRKSNKIRIESAGYAKQLPWDTRQFSYAPGSEMFERMQNQRHCDAGLAEFDGRYYLDFGGVVPKLGDRIPFSWSITTVDGIVNAGTTLLTVSEVDMSNVVQVAPPMSFTENGSRMIKVDIVEGEEEHYRRGSARCTLVVNHRPNGSADASQFEHTTGNLPYLQIIDIPVTNADPSGDQYFAVPYPFGKPFKIEIVGATADGLVGRSEYTHEAFDEYRDRTRMWNYGTGLEGDEWYEIFVKDGENPSETVATAYTSNNVKTTEREWELVQFGNTPGQSRSVAGVVYDGLLENHVMRTENFSKCKYAWYRSFDGEVMRVAVVNVSETREPQYTSVSVDMRRTDV